MLKPRQIFSNTMQILKNILADTWKKMPEGPLNGHGSKIIVLLKAKSLAFASTYNM